MYRKIGILFVHAVIITASSCAGCSLQTPWWKSQVSVQYPLFPFFLGHASYSLKRESHQKALGCSVMHKKTFKRFTDKVDGLETGFEAYLQTRLCAEYSVQEIVVADDDTQESMVLFQQIHRRDPALPQALRLPIIKTLDPKHLMIYYDDCLGSTFLLRSPVKSIQSGLQPQSAEHCT